MISQDTAQSLDLKPRLRQLPVMFPEYISFHSLEDAIQMVAEIHATCI